ncbi:translation initiation factor IF-2 subunit beta [Halobellus sp. GM3]|uniref:translation initiation factor IF-2 subunit beta n=1 Tax=Halobellus sp. GM3 TaxID=3458410 RepID=UPI00403DE172
MEYDEQLERALEQSPDITEGGDRFAVPDPALRTEGHATVWENFAATHDRLARDPDHLLGVIQSALGTSARIDDRGRARFTGDFKQRRVADALASYVEGFVTCSECGSPDTRLTDEHGTTVLKCDACGALSTVPEV